MTPDQERWAEAPAVLRQHGDFAPMFVAERFGSLALHGDTTGVARWKAIAARVHQLMTAART